MVQRREQANRAHDGEPCAYQRRHRRILHKPSLKREFTTRLLHYYESNDDVPFRSWLKDNAIGRLPGGITSVESRRLELKRSGTATVDQNLPVYQTAMSMRAQTPAY